MLGRIHQSNFASSHCQLTLPHRQSCKTIEFARAATSTLGRMALAMPELEQQLRSAHDLRGHGARPHGRRGHEDRASLPHGARPQRARSRPLFDLEGPAPPPPPPPPPCQPRLGRARHGIARDEPFAWPHEQFALPGLAQTAPSPRHMPTRQVAPAVRRRPACALLSGVRGCCATMRARAPQRARRPSRPRAAPPSRALASRGDCAAWPSADSSRSLPVSRGASRARGHRPRPTDAAAMRLWPRGRRRWPSLVPTRRAIDCVWRRARCPRRCATSPTRGAAGPRCVRLPSAAASAVARARAQARSGQPTSTTDHTRCWLCVGLEHAGSGARRRRCAVATRSARHGARARYGPRRSATCFNVFRGDDAVGKAALRVGSDERLPA